MRKYREIEWMNKMDLWYTEDFNFRCSLHCNTGLNYSGNMALSYNYDTSCIFNL